MLTMTPKRQPMSSEDLLSAALDDSDFDDFNATDLEDLYFRCTNNTVYVLDASNTQGESEEMARLFATPAGRALVTTNTPTPGSSFASQPQVITANNQENPANNVGKTRRKERRKASSAELYREAATLLGLTCTLTDNCRCLECQSRYFECDDEENSDPGLAAGTPALLDHVLSHPLTCVLQ